MAPNYANTNLYELRTLTEGYENLIYRGKTTRDISKRLYEHLHDYENYLRGTRDYCSSFEIVMHGNVKIELVRVANCRNKKHSNRVEGKFIREVKCVNIMMPGRSKAEGAKIDYQKNKQRYQEQNKKRYQKNKEHNNAEAKKWREAHPEYEKNRHKKTMCECGHEVGWREVAYENSRHRNTWKHIHDFIHL
jgi:hypothetical protein